MHVKSVITYTHYLNLYKGQCHTHEETPRPSIHYICVYRVIFTLNTACFSKQH